MVGRGALAGALVAAVGYLLARFVVRHWQGLLVLGALLWLLGQCSNGSDQTGSEAQAVARKIAIRGVVANRAPFGRVDSVTATVVNGSPARVYDLRLRCEFSRMGDPEQRSRVTSYYHLAYVRPGARERLTLKVGGNGSLFDADPASFSCEPWYEIEQSDLLRATSQSHRDLRAQIGDTLTSTTIPSRVRPDHVAVLVEGQITDAAPWPVAGVTISCRAMVDAWGNTEVITRTLAISVDPGETVTLSGQVGEVKAQDPKHGIQHHCRLTGIRRSQA